MSIAVSVCILPSRRLWRLHVLLYLLVLLAAACAPHASWQLALAAAVALAACRGHGFVNLARLDISGVGAMRLAVYPLMAGSYVAGRAGMPARAPPAIPLARGVSMLPGSTLWPWLLLLRLRAEDGVVHWLAVLPDSVGPEAWRRLALALRAIAARTPAPCGAEGAG